MTKGSQIVLNGIPPERSARAGGKLLVPRDRAGLSRVTAVWRALIDLIAPLGYEDETGFHYGESPNQRRLS